MRSLWWKARPTCWQQTHSGFTSNKCKVACCAGPLTAKGGCAAHPFGRRGERCPTVMKSNPTVMRASLWWLERSERALSHGSRVVGFTLPTHHPRPHCGLDLGMAPAVAQGWGWALVRDGCAQWGSRRLWSLCVYKEMNCKVWLVLEWIFLCYYANEIQYWLCWLLMANYNWLSHYKLQLRTLS